MLFKSFAAIEVLFSIVYFTLSLKAFATKNKEIIENFLFFSMISLFSATKKMSKSGGSTGLAVVGHVGGFPFQRLFAKLITLKNVQMAQ